MSLSKHSKLTFLSGVALFLSLTTSAHAETTPSISGEVVSELQNEYTSESDDTTTDEYNNMFFRSEIAPTVQFKDNVFIDGVAQ